MLVSVVIAALVIAGSGMLILVDVFETVVAGDSVVFVDIIVTVVGVIFLVGLSVITAGVVFIVVGLFVVVVVHFSSPETSFSVPGSISSETLLYFGCLQQISDPQKHFASRGPRSILRFFLLPFKPLMFIIVAPFVIISPAKQP